MYTTIIFDLGGVLIDWNPEYLYRKIFSDEEEMKSFLTNVCSPSWNEEQDGGRSLSSGTEILTRQFPAHKENIELFYNRWPEMLGGALEETVEIFKELKATKRYKIYALTNWSAETFPIAKEQFAFLSWFDDIVVSGEERMRKPFPEFYQLLLERFSVKPEEAIFIDDNQRNIDAAKAIGIHSITFLNAQQLRTDLNKLGFL